MARRVVSYNAGGGEADGAGMIGKVIHVYTTYAGALARSAAVFAKVYAVNALTGVVGAQVTQTAGTATTAAVGPTVDTNGWLFLGLNDDAIEYWLMPAGVSGAGRWQQPHRVSIPRSWDEMSSSSSCSSVATRSSSCSSSST